MSLDFHVFLFLQTSTLLLVICFSYSHILNVKVNCEYCSHPQSILSIWWWKAVAWPSFALPWEHQCQQFPSTYQEDLCARKQHATWWLLFTMSPEIWTRFLAMLIMVMELLCKLQEKSLSVVSITWFCSCGRYCGPCCLNALSASYLNLQKIINIYSGFFKNVKCWYFVMMKEEGLIPFKFLLQKINL